MDVKNFVMAVVGMVLAAVMIGGALLPSVASAVDDERTIYNNGENLRYSELFSGSSSISDLNITLYVSSFTNDELKITNNGVESTINPANYQGTLIMCDQLNIRWDPGNGNVRLSSASDPLNILTQNALVAPLTISIVGGNVTVTDSADYTATVTPTKWLFIPDENGLWETVLSTDSGVYINSLDQIYFSTIITTGNVGFIDGHNGVASSYSGESYTWTFENMERVAGYVDLYRVNITDFRFSDNMPHNADGSEIIPFQLIVPRYIDAHTSNNLAASALFNALPLIAIAGLVLAGVYVFINRK